MLVQLLPRAAPQPHAATGRGCGKPTLVCAAQHAAGCGGQCTRRGKGNPRRRGPGAEREKRADILEAEGARNSQILRAEGAKQSAILEAEGRRDAAFRDAEARERLAEAEAKATTMMSVAISEGDVSAINYFVAQKYTEALGKMASAPNHKVIMMPLEASSLIGSLGGIGAIAQEIFGKDGGNGSSSRPVSRSARTLPAAS